MNHEEFEPFAVADAFGDPEPWSDQAREHLRTCDACADQLRAMHEVVAYLGATTPAVAPPAELKVSILASAGSTALPATPSEDSVEEERKRAPVWWLASAAMFLLALWGWSELRMNAAREQFAAAEADQRRLSEENRRLAARDLSFTSALATISARDSKVVNLSPAQQGSTACARFFIAPSLKSAFGVFDGLPASQSHSTYQLWILRSGELKPQSGGLFNVPPSGHVELKLGDLTDSDLIRALAVTMEPDSGSSEPTGPKMLEGTI